MGQLVFIPSVPPGGAVGGTGTDKHLVRWDGTGVPLIEDSLWVLDDLGNMRVPVSVGGFPTLASLDNQFGSTPDAVHFLISGSNNQDSDLYNLSAFAGALFLAGGSAGSGIVDGNGMYGGLVYVIGGDGGSAVGAGSVPGSGGQIFLSGGVGGSRTDLTLAEAEGGGIKLRVGPQASQDPQKGAGMAFTGQSAFFGSTGTFTMSGGIFDIPSPFPGSGIGTANIIAPPGLAPALGNFESTSLGGDLFMVGGQNFDFTNGGAGGQILLASGFMGTNIGNPLRGGDLLLGASQAFYLDSPDAFTRGSASGNIDLALSVIPSTGPTAFLAEDGGFYMSAVDGIVYWRLHSIGDYLIQTAPVDDLQGSQRLHIMTLDQEAAMEPSFTAATPDTGFLHFALGDVFTSPGGIEVGGYNFGFRGRRDGYYGGLPPDFGGAGVFGSITRSVARIFTGNFDDGGFDGSGKLLVTHNLNCICPNIQIWKSDGIGGYDLAVFGVDYTLHIEFVAPGSDPLNSVTIQALVPFAPAGAYITIVGF